MTEEPNNEICRNNEPEKAPDRTEDRPGQTVKDSSVNESTVSAQLDNIKKCCESSSNQLQEVKEALVQLLEHCKALADNARYVEIVADCQRQAAEYANDVVERHALNPAVETVFALTNLIRQLHEQSASLLADHGCCKPVSPIFDALSEAVKIADARCDRLDIERLSPNDLDDFDSQEHDIKQAAATDDSSKHRKIKETLAPGLIYRGKVLRQAKVCIYRYIQKQEPDSKEQNNG